MEYNNDMLNKREHYYKQVFVIFELLKSMKDREVIFMSKKENWKCIRGLWITNLDNFKLCFDAFNFFEKDYNIYISCAKYKHIPKMTFNLSERQKETGVFFEKMAYEYIYDYDILLDFDIDLVNNDFINVMYDVRKVWQILYNNKIAFNCFFSGSGVQIIIFGYQIDMKNKKYDEVHFLNIKTLLENIKERFNLKSLCIKGFGNITKIRKCEYSLVNDSVILPVYNLSTIEEYKLIRFDCNVVLKEVVLKNRGLCILNHNEITPFNNFNLFLDKYNLKENLKNW